MESAISVLLLPFSLDPWNSAESMRTTMALWGKIRFPTLVPYGAPISPCWPHLAIVQHAHRDPQLLLLITLSKEFIDTWAKAGSNLMTLHMTGMNIHLLLMTWCHHIHH
jgi:hypothetical protein